MRNKVQNVYNENCIIINTSQNSTISNCLDLNESFAYDLRNLLEIIRDTATDAEAEDLEKSYTAFFRIRSLANVLLDKINPEKFHELNDLLKNLKSK